jgi:hypothetical protein
MVVIDINFLNLKTKQKISGKEAAVSRKTIRYINQINKLTFLKFALVILTDVLKNLSEL